MFHSSPSSEAIHSDKFRNSSMPFSNRWSPVTPYFLKTTLSEAYLGSVFQSKSIIRCISTNWLRHAIMANNSLLRGLCYHIPEPCHNEIQFQAVSSIQESNNGGIWPIPLQFSHTYSITMNAGHRTQIFDWRANATKHNLCILYQSSKSICLCCTDHYMGDLLEGASSRPALSFIIIISLFHLLFLDSSVSYQTTIPNFV